MSGDTSIAHRIAAQPIVYDLIQFLAGLNVSRRRLRPLLAETAGHRVLDVGGGTGLFLAAFPPSAQYIWLDNDVEKLIGFRTRQGHFPAFLGDGTRIGLGDGSVDYATCIGVAHHLDDAQLARLVAELARVVRKKVFILDPLASDAWQSRVLWHYDRGSHPRTAAGLASAFAARFDEHHSETYAIYHRYLIWVGQKRLG